MGIKPFKKLIANKSRVSASEYNRMSRLVEGLMNAGIVDGIVDSSGILIRKRPPTIIPTTLMTNLVGWWQFNNTAKDSSKKANDGTLMGTASVSRNILELDGDSDYVRVTSHSSLNFGAKTDFTIATPFKSSSAATQRIANKKTATTGYDVYITDGKIYALIADGVDTVSVNTGVAGEFDDGKWHRLVVTFDRDDVITIYIDGVSEATSASIAGVGNIDNAANLGIGVGIAAGGFFDGQIDETMMWGRKLSLYEIYQVSGIEDHRYAHFNQIFGSARIFEVQSAATEKDGIYNCYEQKLDATDWGDTGGENKFLDLNTTSVEVFNLAEYDPEEEYIAHLAAGDLIVAFRVWDDENNARWVGVPFRQANADRARLAYCKDAAGADDTIDCYLDKNTTGTVISVKCNISGGTALDKAIRRLKIGDPLLVEKVGATWYAIEGFQTLDEDKGLEISGDKLVVKIDTDELQFGTNGDAGKLQTKLDECPLDE